MRRLVVALFGCAMAMTMAMAMAHASAAEFLTGKLLVAQPALDDPNFARSVVLIVRHDDEGAFGLIINRFAEERTVADLLELFGQQAEGGSKSVPVFFGGPVGKSTSLALHDDGFSTSRTEKFGDRFAVSPTVDALRAFGGGMGPARLMIFFGYAGWYPGQLEAELKTEAWAVVDAAFALVFDPESERIWERARSRIRLDL